MTSVTLAGSGIVSLASGSSAGPELATTRVYSSLWPTGTELAPGFMVTDRSLGSRTGVVAVAQLSAGVGSSSVAESFAVSTSVVPAGQATCAVIVSVAVAPGASFPMNDVTVPATSVGTAP